MIRVFAKDLASAAGMLSKALLNVAKPASVLAAPRIQSILVHATMDKRAFNTGALARGWEVIPLDAGLMVINSTGYSQAVEYGRKAGRMPPVNALARWAQRKLSLDAKAAQSAGWAIARAIASRGIKGRFIVRDVAPQIMQVYAGALMSLYPAEVERLARLSAANPNT